MPEKLKLTQNVIWLEADSNYTRIHFCDASTRIVTRTLKSFEKKLANHPAFVRIHKSYFINRHFIHEIIGGKPKSFLLTNGVELRVARRKNKQLY